MNLVVKLFMSANRLLQTLWLYFMNFISTFKILCFSTVSSNRLLQFLVFPDFNHWGSPKTSVSCFVR